MPAMSPCPALVTRIRKSWLQGARSKACDGQGSRTRSLALVTLEGDNSSLVRCRGTVPSYSYSNLLINVSAWFLPCPVSLVPSPRLLPETTSQINPMHRNPRPQACFWETTDNDYLFGPDAAPFQLGSSGLVI